MTTCRVSSLYDCSRRARPSVVLALLAGLVMTTGLANAADDDAALGLTSAPVEATPATPSATRWFIEAATGRTNGRNGSPSRTLSRASLDEIGRAHV